MQGSSPAPWTPWRPAIKATLDPNMHVLVPKCPWTHGHHGLEAALGSKSPWTISPASGEEADDHTVRKFMKDAERRYERHIQIMLLVGRFMKDANIIKKERTIILSSSY